LIERARYGHDAEKTMTTSILKLTIPAALLLSAANFGSSYAAEAASPADKAFVAKVSQGGMFEVALGKLAADKGATQEIKDNGVAEAHDHELVGAKLKSVASDAEIEFSSKLNEEFQGKLDKLSGLSGNAFDEAYVKAMEEVHKVDGGLFAEEAKEGGTSGFKAFAAETHSIVEMHIGALRATDVKK
jgi:putative membrane protein